MRLDASGTFGHRGNAGAHTRRHSPWPRGLSVSGRHGKRTARGRQRLQTGMSALLSDIPRQVPIPMPIELTIMNESKVRLSTAYLRTKLARVLQELRVRTGQWTILLVRDARMRALHAQTMNIPTTTDVLTFDMRDRDSQ